MKWTLRPWPVCDGEKVPRGGGGSDAGVDSATDGALMETVPVLGCGGGVKGWVDVDMAGAAASAGTRDGDIGVGSGVGGVSRVGGAPEGALQ